MPLDRETQLSLGLNHGVPAWYRRAHGLGFSPRRNGNVAQSNVMKTEVSDVQHAPKVIEYAAANAGRLGSGNNDLNDTFTQLPLWRSMEYVHLNG